MALLISMLDFWGVYVWLIESMSVVWLKASMIIKRSQVLRIQKIWYRYILKDFLLVLAFWKHPNIIYIHTVQKLEARQSTTLHQLMSSPWQSMSYVLGIRVTDLPPTSFRVFCPSEVFFISPTRSHHLITSKQLKFQGLRIGNQKITKNRILN